MNFTVTSVEQKTYYKVLIEFDSDDLKELEVEYDNLSYDNFPAIDRVIDNIISVRHDDQVPL